MNKRLFVVGSINVDLNITTERIPEKGETITGSDYFEVAGGKGANQAVAASALEVETYMIANVGDDLHGENSIKNLKNFEVNTEFVQRDQNSPTGIAMIIKSEHDNRIILNPGANDTINIELVEEGLSQARDGDIFLAQLENPIDLICQAIVKAKERGLITVFNPAPAKRIPEEIYAHIDYLILNETETELLLGKYPSDKESAIMLAKVFIDKGVGTCIITLGEKGSVLVDKYDEISIAAKKVDAVDSTGAGDSFIGAFISGLVEGLAKDEILERATIVSAFMCTVDGAQSEKLNKENIKI